MSVLRSHTSRSSAIGSPGLGHPPVPPLVATNDPDLLDHAVRWCAAVGATPDVAHDVTGVHRGWRTAPAVLLGVDLAAHLRPGDLARRDQVVLIAHDRDAAWRHAVSVGAGDVAAPADEPAAVRAVTTALDGRHEGCLVTVVGATGGAGASTFAATLGLVGAARGLAPVVVDADPLAGGLDLLLGAERQEGARWEDLDEAGGPWGADALRRAVPQSRGVSLLTWKRDPAVATTAAIGDVTPTAVRGFDLVVVDLPRHRCDDAADVLASAVLTVLVVPDDVRSVAAGWAMADRLEHVTGDLVVVTAHRSGGAGRAAVGDLIGKPVLGTVRSSRRIRAALERGDGPGAWRSGRRAASSVLDLLGLSRPQPQAERS